MRSVSSTSTSGSAESSGAPQNSTCERDCGCGYGIDQRKTTYGTESGGLVQSIPDDDHSVGTSYAGCGESSLSSMGTNLWAPKTKLYVDLGKEFQGAFELGAEYDATVVEPSALERPTQRGITERAGRSYLFVLRKAMLYHACNTEAEWQELVDITNMTCNRLANKSGYSPIQRVLGYNPRVPGGLMTGGYNDWSTNGRAGDDLQMKRATEMRMAAPRAFHEADCCQALRNSLHAGHRPVRDFEVGQTVYFWRKGTDGPKKNGPQYWRGPARVVMVAPPTTIWLNFKGFIVKAAPEQLRHATEEEEYSLSNWH